jgi:hypothetical protein
MIVKKTAFEAQWEEVARCVLTPMDDKCSKWKDVFVEPELHFRMEEITWLSKIAAKRVEVEVEVEIVSGSGPTCKAIKVPKPVEAPHWKRGAESVVEDNTTEMQHYDRESKKPGVYLMKDEFGNNKGENQLEVKIQLYGSGNKSGKFRLRGKLKGNEGAVLEMKSKNSFELKSLDKPVPMEIENLPSDLQHYEGDSDWEIEEEGTGRKYQIDDRPRLEVFVVYNDPTLFSFYSDGVWVEALRLMLGRVGGAGITGNKPDDISGQVTKYCHTLHGMVYDTIKGASCFLDKDSNKNVLPNEGGIFRLMEYIERQSSTTSALIPPRPANTVNCYDQAAAVQVLCGCLGIVVEWKYQEPFGFINETDLIGVGSCNNPFYEGNKTAAVVPSDAPNRTKFGNHAFVEVLISQHIRDACAGPHHTTEALRQYLESSIDGEHSRKLWKYGTSQDYFDYLVGETKATPGVTRLL